MAHRIIYHPQAEAELDKLYADIAVEAGNQIAGNFVDGVITFIESLETFPERGTVRESVIRGLRIIGYGRSVGVAFCVQDHEVFVLGIFARGRPERGARSAHDSERRARRPEPPPSRPPGHSPSPDYATVSCRTGRRGGCI